MPTVEEISAKLAGDRFFSKFELSKGYWQVSVREEDRDLMTSICQTGLFSFFTMSDAFQAGKCSSHIQSPDATNPLQQPGHAY